MITIKDIIKWSKPHPVTKYITDKGRITRFGDDNVSFSIVGGARGLYGDFVNTFEVAIFNNKTGDLLTNFFYPDESSNVIGYMSAKKVEELVNSVIKRENLSVE
jgi:hypothetical protein